MIAIETQLELEAQLLEILTLIDEMPVYSLLEAFEVNSYPENFDTVLHLIEQVIPVVEHLYGSMESIELRAATRLMYDYGTRQGLRTIRHNVSFTHVHLHQMFQGRRE